MNIQTVHNNTYSYLRQTNEIVPGIVEDNSYAWTFAPYSDFSSMTEVAMFIIALTEQCNLRCTYCCYSGEYIGNHQHNAHSLSEGDIAKIYSFIKRMAVNRPIHICFYGGEPLTKFALIQHAVNRGRKEWGDKVSFSVSTNGTLLNEDNITWLVDNNIEIAMTIDGTERFHDRYRKDNNGEGSFRKVHKALNYLHNNTFQKVPIIVLLMTLSSISDIEAIAKEWQEDDLLRNYPPTHISGLTPNFAKGVVEESWEEFSNLYIHLIDTYQHHPNWVVLQTFFDELIEVWKNRPIFNIEGDMPLATCMPVNTKLYIDAHLQIAVCEKFNDRFRIGTIEQGIDWNKANELAKEYYKKREKRCAFCPAVHMCNLCPTAIEYTDEQWDVLCKNERIAHRLGMFVFCEMAERGMLTPPSVPVLTTARCILNEVTEDDIPALKSIFTDATTQRFLPDLCEIAQSEEGIKQILKSFIIYLKRKEGILWGIRYENQLAGFIALMDLSFNPTIFFAMHPYYRNKGLMTESIKIVTHYVSETKLCNELHTEVDAENIPSQCVLEKCGYSVGKEDKKRIYEITNINKI